MHQCPEEIFDFYASTAWDIKRDKEKSNLIYNNNNNNYNLNNRNIRIGSSCQNTPLANSSKGIVIKNIIKDSISNDTNSPVEIKPSYKVTKNN